MVHIKLLTGPISTLLAENSGLAAPHRLKAGYARTKATAHVLYARVRVLKTDQGTVLRGMPGAVRLITRAWRPAATE